MLVKLNKAKEQFQYKLEYYNQDGIMTGYSYINISELDSLTIGEPLRMKTNNIWATISNNCYQPCKPPCWAENESAK